MIPVALDRPAPRHLPLARLPVRLRLTLLFAAVMALVLLLIGAFLYWRMAATLDEAIDAELEVRYEQAAATVSAGLPLDVGGSGLPQQDDALVIQLLTREGQVLSGTAGLRKPILSNAQVIRARELPLPVSDAPVPGNDDPFRLLAGPVDSHDAVLVVGRSSEDRSESLEALSAQLAVGGPLVLLASSLLAYLLAIAALRPVESMRRNAEVIGSPGRGSAIGMNGYAEPAGEIVEDRARAGGPLPVPPGDDELARLGNTLNSMLQRIESSLSRERRFLADASHELRTPLAMLRMEVDLALKRGRTNEELQAALQSVGRESVRLSGLADDLLVLARADQGELALENQRLNAREMLASVAQRFGPRAESEGRTLCLEAPDGLTLHGDRRRLEQALGNLVDNALIHGRGRVVLRAVERGCPPARSGFWRTAGDGPHAPSGLELHVLDEGPGLSPAFLPRAFERFAREDAARSTEGAGLGLAIAEAIAKAHGGWATAANRRPNGADIFLVLPAEPGILCHNPPAQTST